MQAHQIISSVRALLDEPNSQHPTERHLWTLLMGILQDYHNKLNETGQNWDVNSWQFSTSPNTSEYLITAPNFGKPLYIRTFFPDPQIKDREVPIVDIQNFDYPASNRQQAWQYWDKDHPAAAIGFYGKYATGMGKYLRVYPVPEGIHTYTIWYKVGPIPDLGLSTDFMLPEHHHYVTTRVAMAALPYCRWDELDMTLITTKVTMLTQSLGMLFHDYQDSFDRYRTNLRQEVMTPRVLYGQFGDW